MDAANSSIDQSSSYTDMKISDGDTSRIQSGRKVSTSLGTTVKQHFYDILPDLDLTLCGRSKIPQPASSH
jgi:hypothetical protein